MRSLIIAGTLEGALVVLSDVAPNTMSSLEETVWMIHYPSHSVINFLGVTAGGFSIALMLPVILTIGFAVELIVYASLVYLLHLPFAKPLAPNENHS